MPAEELVAADFSGGQAGRLAATDFTERQWAALYGLVLESPAEVRSQWACQQVGVKPGLIELSEVGGILVGLDAAGDIWWSLPVRGTAAQVKASAWTKVAIAADAGRRILGTAPIRAVGLQGFQQSLLVGGLDAEDVYALYRSGNSIAFDSVTNQYPNATTDDAMPRGNVSTMWGDYLVLGDIEWVQSGQSAFGAGNVARYPNGLWFSQPGSVRSWDLLDVEFMGTKPGASGTQVLDLVPIDIGLLVLTTGGAFLLRGDPSDHSYEEVRVGLAPAGDRGATWWPHIGAAAWADAAGQVWHSNGTSFARLDEPLGLDPQPGGIVEAWLDHLLVARGARLFSFRAFEDDGAWTELVPPPGGVTAFVPIENRLFMLDGAGQCWQFDREALAERGTRDGAAIEVTAKSRTWEAGDGHSTSTWHRFGVRASTAGAGTLQRLVMRPGPALDGGQPTHTSVLAQAVTGRGEWVVPGHGPSREASLEVVFSGDVSLEQVTVWRFNGKASR